MKQKHLFLRGLLWMIATYHIVIGLLAIFSREGVVVGANILAAYQVDAGESFFYIIKPFGVYLIAFGASMVAAAWNPSKNRAIISIGVVLFGIRVIQRIIFASVTQEVFKVSAGRNAVTIAIVAGFALALAFFRWKLYQEMHGPEERDDVASQEG